MLLCLIHNLSWIAASVAKSAVVNRNGNRTLLARCVSTLFINAKTAAINDLRKLRNSSPLLVIFLVVRFNKIALFSKDLITFILTFVSLFATLIPEPLPDANFL